MPFSRLATTEFLHSFAPTIVSIEKEVMEGKIDDTELQPPSGSSDPQKSGSQASTAKKKKKSKGNVFWTTRLD